MMKIPRRFLTYIIFICSICSCSRKPPYQEHSIMYWRSDTRCVELLCGGVEAGLPPKERKVCPPEIWRFGNGKWRLIATAYQLPKGRSLSVFNEKRNELLFVSRKNGESWTWDGHRWVEGKDFPYGGVRGLPLYNASNHQNEMYQLDAKKRWIITGNKWEEKAFNTVPADRITVQYQYCPVKIF